MTQIKDRLALTTITVEKDQNHAMICPIGDMHIGNIHHDEKSFENVLNWLYDNPQIKIIGMGDWVECGTKASFGLFDQDKFVGEQIKDVVKMFKPLAKRGQIIGMHEGNHENRVKKVTGLDITESMAAQLKVPYLKMGMLHKIRVKKVGQRTPQIYTMYSTHGGSGARKLSGKMSACMALQEIAEVEMYIMGHVHALHHHKIDKYVIERERSVLRPRHFIICGSYLTYWGSYAQAKAYGPSGTSGSPKIKLHVDNHRISVSL